MSDRRSFLGRPKKREVFARLFASPGNRGDGLSARSRPDNSKALLPSPRIAQEPQLLVPAKPQLPAAPASCDETDSSPDDLDCDSEAEYSTIESGEASGIDSQSYTLLTSEVLLGTEFNDVHEGSSVFSESDHETPSRPHTAPEALTKCEDCQSDCDDVSWCNGCGMRLCAQCWSQQAPHKNKVPGHSKTSLTDMATLNGILNLTGGEAASEEYLQAEFGSKWFGVTIQKGQRMQGFLTATNRYRELSMATGFPGEKYPALVSFVGETGAGKSTLIRALVQLALINTKRQSDRSYTHTPIVGDPQNLDTPTSGDVHLFKDPSTYATRRPCFYADCEGLRGGTRLPMAVTKIDRIKQRVGEVKGVSLSMRWAKQEQLSREWMVERFYPRILFTFSDIVCYVTNNFKTIESIISRLIQWADTVLEKSVNQPMLPYAIVIVNALDPKDGTQEWWQDTLTGTQLQKNKDCIRGDQNLIKLVEQWEKRNKKINTLEELVRCYYTDIKIMCIPNINAKHSSPSFLLEQYSRLHEEIRQAADKTSERRKKAELLLNSDDLNAYFGYAFDHFSRNGEQPFDFLAAALAHNPVRRTLTTHVVKAAVSLMVGTFRSSFELFKGLAPLIASSILLDVCRKNLPRKSLAAAKILEEYEMLCVTAVQTFYEGHWPCRFTDNNRRCVNVANKHPKGHQLSSGKIITVGEYQHEPKELKTTGQDFFAEVASSYKQLWAKLIALNDADNKGVRPAAVENQRDILSRDVYQAIFNGQSGALASHTTCFSCFFHTPVHVLRCGHVICDTCMDDFSEMIGLKRTLRNCPLCGGQRNLTGIYNKEPRQASPRILSLDGGGVRSIIQLEILKALEKQIDLEMPIQEFFDLVVGTSAGGIVALGLASEGMAIENCSKMFMDFAIKAFTTRKGGKVPVLKYAVYLHHNSKYESKGLNDVLKDSFGNKKLFGEIGDSNGRKAIKVGVTMTSSSGNPVFVANYNRSSPENNPSSYHFLRAENKNKELKVWEAARGTSAAPLCFKPFHHQPTDRIFTDGALNFNNPVEIAYTESQLLWPDQSQRCLILSIGTGSMEAPQEIQTGSETVPTPQSGGSGDNLRSFVRMGKRQIEQSINCEKAWSDFMAKSDRLDQENAGRYVRMNVEFPKLPKIDKYEFIDDLIDGVKSYCDKNSSLLRDTANKLIASLFYLMLEGIEENKDGYLCKGSILCRLGAGTKQLLKLTGRLKQWGDSIFTVEINGRGHELGPLPARTLKFVEAGDIFIFSVRFQVKHHSHTTDEQIKIRMKVGSEGDSPALISGFPATLNELEMLKKRER
ncbi:hypothetical protein FN846DRAFT_955469 [Sphaerosporella brunnea]|uniref:PNPLA domain-containing protein n=1 Tax=Sphaerosporella brunnea TaxID=1250544 RepID=A0A5J5ESN5_9PEZI|nr:hypothetical protein FN846DRAFT_955469 [Sphaerosporella brunnea]